MQTFFPEVGQSRAQSFAGAAPSFTTFLKDPKRDQDYLLLFIYIYNIGTLLRVAHVTTRVHLWRAGTRGLRGSMSRLFACDRMPQIGHGGGGSDAGDHPQKLLGLYEIDC
jgi:hypothetical protein